MVDIDVIVPTLRSEELTRLLINSFEKFKPENISVNYVIVENSNEELVVRLISLGADINATLNNGITPLMNAVLKRNICVQ